MIKLDLGLKDKNVLVTGSSKGIGKAIASGFVEEGCNVVICARQHNTLKSTKDELQALTNQKVLMCTCDLTKFQDIDVLFQFTIDELDNIDILVNNSGGPPSGHFRDFNISDWESAFELNLKNVIYLCKKVIPLMKAKNYGRIINMTSISVKQPLDNLILSNVARAGVTGLTKSLANELAPYNILVNSVLPGYTLTSRVESLSEDIAKKENISIEEVKNRWIKNIPLGRIAEPEEIANLVVFLASEKASYITGAAIQVDGGFIKSLL